MVHLDRIVLEHEIMIFFIYYLVSWKRYKTFSATHKLGQIENLRFKNKLKQF
jgi:hypothetical protein